MTQLRDEYCFVLSERHKGHIDPVTLSLCLLTLTLEQPSRFKSHHIYNHVVSVLPKKRECDTIVFNTKNIACIESIKKQRKQHCIVMMFLGSASLPQMVSPHDVHRYFSCYKTAHCTHCTRCTLQSSSVNKCSCIRKE